MKSWSTDYYLSLTHSFPMHFHFHSEIMIVLATTKEWKKEPRVNQALKVCCLAIVVVSGGKPPRKI